MDALLLSVFHGRLDDRAKGHVLFRNAADVSRLFTPASAELRVVAAARGSQSKAGVEACAATAGVVLPTGISARLRPELRLKFVRDRTPSTRGRQLQLQQQWQLDM